MVTLQTGGKYVDHLWSAVNFKHRLRGYFINFPVADLRMGGGPETIFFTGKLASDYIYPRDSDVIVRMLFFVCNIN